MIIEQLINQLDHSAEYRLSKVKAKDDTAFRFVNPGDSRVGPAYMWGESLVVGSLVTSPVKEFIKEGDNFMVETNNSIYRLEKVNE